MEKNKSNKHLIVENIAVVVGKKYIENKIESIKEENIILDF